MHTHNFIPRETTDIAIALTPAKIEVLQNSLALSIGESLFDLDPTPDVIEQLLSDTRSPHTKRAYEKDIRDFFLFIAKLEPDTDLVLAFLHLEQHQAVTAVLKYKSHLMNTRKLAEATVNRRLSAIKSMVKMGRKLGVCAYTLEHIQGEAVEAYRDTSGVAVDDYRKILNLVDRKTLKGKRDYAILRLLWDFALRRNEICSLNVGDFNQRDKTLEILGKGKGTQKISINLVDKTATALADWLNASKRIDYPKDAPMFVSLAYRGNGQRLTGESVRALVDKLSQQAGITKKMSPHRVRHSSITAVLDVNNGNHRETKKFSRHANVQTVIKYDDNRQDLQRQMAQKISDLL